MCKPEKEHRVWKKILAHIIKETNKLEILVTMKSNNIIISIIYILLDIVLNNQYGLSQSSTYISHVTYI